MPDLVVATINLFHDYPRQLRVGERLEIVADALARERADVVLVQETFVSKEHGHWTERLVAALRSRGAPYESFYAPANGSFAENGVFEEGSAILSRHPIVSAAAEQLAPWREVHRPIGDALYPERRIAVRATIAKEDGAPIDVFGAHVTDLPNEGSGASARREQLEHLARLVAERPSRGLPAIVGGDLNAEPSSDEIRSLTEAGWVDLHAGHPGLTSDSRGRDLEDERDTADRRIDYLLVAGATRVEGRDARVLLGTAVGGLWASDHNGLVADVSFD